MSTTNIQKFSTLDKINQKYPIYNEYRAFYTNPDIRQDMITRNGMPSILGLALDMGRAVMGGTGYRTVRTRRFLSQEITSNKNPYRFTTEAANAAGAAGAAVTVKIKAPYTADGEFTVPVVGHTATTSVKGKPTLVYITNVVDNGADDIDVTFTPINNEVLDLTGGEYTWQYNTRVQYTKSCTSTIQKEAFLVNAPKVVEGYVQKYELGGFACEDDLDQYAYDFAPEDASFYDPLIGAEVNTFCLAPAIMNQVRDKMIFGDYQDFLFCERDNVSDRGFDGLFTAARKRGKFNMPINLSSTTSTIASLTTLAKIYLNEGIKGITIWGDREFIIRMNTILAKIPGYNNFHAKVWGFSQDGMLDWYKFNGISNFLGMNFSIQLQELDGWEQLNYTDIMENFGFVMPMQSFTDSAGRRVPPVEIVKLDNCTGIQFATENSATGASLWYDDTRQRGGRTLDVYAKNSFGLDVHGAEYMGFLSAGNKCY